MNYTTVDGLVVIGSIDRSNHIDLNPADVALLSYEKTEFSFDTKLVLDAHSDIEFVGISVAKEKFDHSAVEINRKFFNFTVKW